MIEKFKNLDAADKPIWVKNPDDEYYRKVKEFFEMIEKLSDFKVKPGVQKFTSFQAREPSQNYSDKK